MQIFNSVSNFFLSCELCLSAIGEFGGYKKNKSETDCGPNKYFGIQSGFSKK